MSDDEQDASPAPVELPFLAKCYIAATAAGAVIAIWWLSLRGITARPAGTLVALSSLAVFFESLPLTLRYGGHLFGFSVGTPFSLAILSVFGVLPAAITELVSSVVSDVIARRSITKIVFNASQKSLSVVAAGAVLEAALGTRVAYPGLSFDYQQLPALLAMLVTFFVVNSLFTGVIIHLLTRWKARVVVARFVSGESLMEAATLLLTPVLAVTVRSNPVLSVFLVAPMAALYRATKLAMENVTLLEDQAVAFRERAAIEEIAREREVARQASERANRAKSAFLSQMSHELRTPLNAVLGFAQLLELEDLSPSQREATAEIIKAGDHLLGLIGEVLDIARIEAGASRLELERIDALASVEECLALLAPLAEARRVTLSLQPDRSPDAHFDVMADRQRLRQIALNLISNAIKYNREGGRVGVSVRMVDESRLRIDVADTGYGIPPERMAQIFTPFDRLGAERSDVEGTGLGLAVTKALVEAMSGSISVVSIPDEGTTFSIELPSPAPSPLAEADHDGAPPPGLRT